MRPGMLSEASKDLIPEPLPSWLARRLRRDPRRRLQKTCKRAAGLNPWNRWRGDIGVPVSICGDSPRCRDRCRCSRNAVGTTPGLRVDDRLAPNSKARNRRKRSSEQNLVPCRLGREVHLQRAKVQSVSEDLLSAELRPEPSYRDARFH